MDFSQCSALFVSDPYSKQIHFSNLYFFSPPEASQWERQATLHWGGREAEEATQEGLPRLQIPTAAPQKWKAQFQFRKWGRRPFGGWGQPQPVPLQGSPPGSGPQWGSRVPSGRWAPPSCCRWAAGSLPQIPLSVTVRSGRSPLGWTAWQLFGIDRGISGVITFLCLYRSEPQSSHASHHS